ncbi:AraC family transcriptional regulator [Spongiimicrobium sp. 3-5]|uniref:AraC family transcriptional regulator n=1 Tax=Spongiimicrobium sp. 3-5 TaxID=3332596 RepID=UPI00397F742F
MEDIKQYHLHKDDHSKLHFELKEAAPYLSKFKDRATKAHRHSFYQILWFTTAGRHYVDYEIIDHKPNTVFFIKKGQIHYFCPESANEGYLFHFNDSFINKYDGDAENKLSYLLFNEIGSSWVNPNKDDITKIDQLTKLISSELKTPEYNYNQQVYFLFQALLTLIERIKQKVQPLSTMADLDYGMAVGFKKLIDVHIHESLTIDHYASQLGVSAKKLTAISKKFLQDTPANIVHGRKILEAKRMLSNHRLSIKEVAYDLGFDQATYFSKYFKKHTGLNPKEFKGLLP